MKENIVRTAFENHDIKFCRKLNSLYANLRDIVIKIESDEQMDVKFIGLEFNIDCAESNRNIIQTIGKICMLDDEHEEFYEKCNKMFNECSTSTTEGVENGVVTFMALKESLIVNWRRTVPPAAATSSK